MGWTRGRGLFDRIPTLTGADVSFGMPENATAANGAGLVGGQAITQGPDGYWYTDTTCTKLLDPQPAGAGPPPTTSGNLSDQVLIGDRVQFGVEWPLRVDWRRFEDAKATFADWVRENIERPTTVEKALNEKAAAEGSPIRVHVESVRHVSRKLTQAQAPGEDYAVVTVNLEVTARVTENLGWLATVGLYLIGALVLISIGWSLGANGVEPEGSPRVSWARKVSRWIGDLIGGLLDGISGSPIGMLVVITLLGVVVISVWRRPPSLGGGRGGAGAGYGGGERSW